MSNKQEKYFTNFNHKAGKLLISLVLSAFSAQTLAAGNTSTSKMPKDRISIAPSLSFTSFALKADGYDVGAKGGMAVGANSYIPSGIDAMDYEVGLMYLQTGGKQGNIFITNELSFNYISMPLGVRYTAHRFSEQTSLYLKGGIAPSFLMSAKQSVSYFGQSSEKDIKGETNSFDAMAYLGIGGTYEIDKDYNILYDLSYVKGTQKVLKDVNSSNEGMIASVMLAVSL